MKYILIILLVLTLTFVSAEIGYNNRNLPRIESPIIPVTQINNNTLNVNSSNCWQGDCLGMRNIFNQTLNTTNNVEFRNISVRNISIIEWILGKNILLSNLGSATFPSTTFQIGTIDVGSGLLSLAILRMVGGTGIKFGAIENGIYVIPQDNATNSALVLSKSPNADDVWVFEVNNASGILNILRINPFTNIRNISTINATNQNITSNHQSYDITSITSLDTQYKNNLDRPIRIDVSMVTSGIFDDRGYLTLKHNYTNPMKTHAIIGVQKGAFSDFTYYLYFEGVMTVQPLENWTIVSTIGGTGTVSLENVWITVI